MKIQLLLVIFSAMFGVNAIAQTWSLKAPLPISDLENAASFTIGNKGYIVTGTFGGSVGSVKLWEYDPGLNTWSFKSDFPGLTRSDAVAFSIGGKGYVGTGTSISSGAKLNDMWEWDQASDTWIQKNNFAGSPRNYAYGFSVNGMGYVGAGWDDSGLGGVLVKDFWQYNPIPDTWTIKDSIPSPRFSGVSFTIGNKGYICAGGNDSGINFLTELLEYDPLLNTWMSKANLPSSGGDPSRGRNMGFGFAIGNKGYIGTGTYLPSSGGMPLYCNDFWEWDQTTNNWAVKASYPGSGRQWTIGLGIGTKGYAGTGEYSGGYYNDFWEYSLTSTGIESSYISSNISIFPNPSNGHFSLSLQNIVSNTQIEIHNMLGENILSRQINSNNTEIDLSKEPKGIYFIKIINSNKNISTLKIIIE